MEWLASQKKNKRESHQIVKFWLTVIYMFRALAFNLSVSLPSTVVSKSFTQPVSPSQSYSIRGPASCWVSDSAKQLPQIVNQPVSQLHIKAQGYGA